MSESIEKSANSVAVVVDKDPHIRELLEDYLTEFGYTITFAGDGYEALDAIRLSPPRLLITEILIPRLDGLALTRILKSEKETKTLPIIVFSALDAAHRAEASGADAFLKKPLEKARVLNILKSVESPR